MKITLLFLIAHENESKNEIGDENKESLVSGKTTNIEVN